MHTIEITEDYTLLYKQAQALIKDEPDDLANLANISSFIYHTIPNLNWVGFYLLKGNDLVLGPFQGLPACTRIPLGKGVCGTAALRRQTLNIENVHDFPGHIACDGASQSELVLPIIIENQLLGVMDLDSPLLDRFDLELEEFMTKIVELIQNPQG
jgi:L-methionine (R)-S-oxide reductase